MGRGHGCCCTGRHRGVDDDNNFELTSATQPRSRYKCLRKFLAITCSQLGLLIFLILYLIGGTFLFTYLEREYQQARLNREVTEVKSTFDQLTGGIYRVRRDLEQVMQPTPRQMALHCVDLQLQTLQSEVQRFRRNQTLKYLQGRQIELRQLRQEVEDLIAVGEVQMLEQILNEEVDINLTSQIQAFTGLASMTRGRQMPIDAAPTSLMNNFLRAVYEAIRAGWVPPSQSPSKPTEVFNEDGLQPDVRVRVSGSNQESILKSRTPRTDPWTLSGSLFYVITVITTIGYGQVAPVTKYGRLATIFYGLFGIPMMLLFLANLGSLMADTFRMLYKSLCCCFISDKKRDSPAPVHSTPCPTARGLNKPTINGSGSPLTLRDIPGRAAISESPKVSRGGGLKNTSALHELVRKTAPLPGVTESLFITLAGSNSVFTRALQARKESRNVRVPVWLILCLFILYMILGALVFAYWEQWTFLDAMYFVFVTVSTIGFGDMLPGIDDPDPVHRLNKFIAANVYLLFGLAMVAMCFDLMQLEVKRRSKKLARRIGLISISVNPRFLCSGPVSFLVWPPSRSRRS
ncbi:Potassium channel subfamily K member 18 [Taenia crassiceps]|uniref:Potassium channel subfamily K member 18 n=1 Tax=Taenia crassiceps TaxID=6207 RepID=A0ABR4Q1J7_9CEST